MEKEDLEKQGKKQIAFIGNKANYKEFKKMVIDEDKSVSQVLDEFIADYIQKNKKK
ncbi:Uncharacterised protein [uncultured archaeon]|nr:Uncharacterised protein [uncultured archaeon]